MTDLIKRLREFVKFDEDNSWLTVHACFTGDCPHLDVNDCIPKLRKAIEEDYKKRKPLDAALEDCVTALETYTCPFCRERDGTECYEYTSCRALSRLESALAEASE